MEEKSGKWVKNKSIIQEMKKNNLYSLHGPFDSFKKDLHVLYKFGIYSLLNYKFWNLTPFFSIHKLFLSIS